MPNENKVIPSEPSQSERELANDILCAINTDGSGKVAIDNETIIAHLIHAENEKQREVLQLALKESVKLQAHYALLLNMHDEGERRIFSTVDEWINRLKETGTIK